MKASIFVVLFGLVFLLLVLGEGVFMISSQAVNLKQLVYIFISLAAYGGLIILHLNNKGKYALQLFFFSYPFLSQTVNYINISGSFFILTPALIFLLIHVLLSKEYPLSKGLLIVYVFCISTLASVFVAQNIYTASSFWILGVGSFAMMAYLMHELIAHSQNSWEQIQSILSALVFGSFAYFLLEIIVFRISPSDIIFVFLRRWDQLPVGRYYTGGYREPAGIGFVYSLLFWPALFIAQQSKKYGYALRNWVILFLVTFMLFLSGTRAAIFNIVNTFIAIWVLQKVFRLKPLIRINMRTLLIFIGFLGVGIYLLSSRPLTTSNARIPSNGEVAIWSVAGRSFVFTGTTAQYFNRTFVSLNTVLTLPLGTGPLNAPIPANSIDGGFGYHFSIISNLFVIGATFGWISLGIWSFLLFYLSYTYYHRRLNTDVSHSSLFSLGVLFLAILWAAHLPGSNYIGPGLNWGNFDYYTKITPYTSALPAEYPSLVSGMILGVITGVIRVNDLIQKKD